MVKIKKLVAKEFEVTESDLSNQLQVGEKYTYLVDPETGKYYRPIDGWEVAATGDTDLADLFIEIKSNG